VPSNNRAFLIASIIATRGIYGLNWYNMAPLYLAISSELSVRLGYLGLVPSSFLLGAALFQLPAGLLAARYGAKRIAMLGMYMLGISTLLSGLARSLGALLALRFLVGVGAALYFSTAIRLLKDIFEARREGLALGLYNAAFNLGAGIGVAGWALVAQLLGWRGSLILSGLAALAFTVENDIVLPRDPVVTTAKLRLALSRDVALLGLALAGFWGSYFAASQYLHSYFVLKGRLDESSSALITSLVLFGGCVGGPLLGHISDRVGRRRALLLAFTTALALSLALTPSYRGALIPAYALLLGLTAGAIFSIMYAIPTGYEHVPGEVLPLALGLINAIQIALGSLIAFVFPLLAEVASFDLAWAALAAFALIPLPLLALVRER